MSKICEISVSFIKILTCIIRTFKKQTSYKTFTMVARIFQSVTLLFTLLDVKKKQEHANFLDTSPKICFLKR